MRWPPITKSETETAKMWAAYLAVLECRDPNKWRRPSENAAEQLERRSSAAYRITQAQLAAEKKTKA